MITIINKTVLLWHDNRNFRIHGIYVHHFIIFKYIYYIVKLKVTVLNFLFSLKAKSECSFNDVIRFLTQRDQDFVFYTVFICERINVVNRKITCKWGWSKAKFPVIHSEVIDVFNPEWRMVIGHVIVILNDTV